MDKLQEGVAVAYFTAPYVEPGKEGFYVVDATESTTEVSVREPVATESVDILDESGEATGQTYEDPVKVKKTDTIEVKHHTHDVKPGQQVWASPDGEGWISENPEGEGDEI